MCIYIVAILFQPFTANAGFVTPTGRILEVDNKGMRFDVYTNSGVLGNISIENLLNALKSIDYTNLNLRGIEKGRLDWRTLLNPKKAHLDIYALAATVGILVSSMNGDPFRSAEMLEVAYIIFKQLHVLEFISGDDKFKKSNYILATSSGVHAFAGMIVERFLRGAHLEKLQSQNDTLISDVLYDQYLELIQRHINPPPQLETYD